jgi:hypothetical protein
MTDRPTDGAPELIERYVREVARRLPAKQRADVVRELRSSLLDALDDRFGPDATWAQAAILLRENGSPKQVAASYRPEDLYLIGPEWYPAFSLVLRIVLTAFSGALVLASALAVVTRPASEVGGVLLSLVNGIVHGGVIAFAIVTAIFHLLQRTEKPPVDFGDAFDPDDLPPAVECDAAGRGEAIAGLIAPPVFLAHLPWISAALLAGMPINAWLIWRHRWSWASRAARLAADLFAVWVLYRIAADVAAAHSELAAAGLPEGVVDSIGWTALAIPAIVGIVILIETGKVAFCHLRHRAPAA